jgi:hypothetical protein
MIAKRARKNPEFPAMVDAARAKRAERLAALKVELDAKVAGLPEPSDDELVDEILKRRRG